MEWFWKTSTKEALNGRRKEKVRKACQVVALLARECEGGQEGGRGRWVRSEWPSMTVGWGKGGKGGACRTQAA